MKRDCSVGQLHGRKITHSRNDDGLLLRITAFLLGSDHAPVTKHSSLLVPESRRIEAQPVAKH